MIKGLTSGSRYMSVNGGYTTNVPIPYSTNHGNPSLGQLKYTSSGDIEVFDGSMWRTMQSSYASVNLTPDAEKLLDWAKKKMQEEQELTELAVENPAIADLVNQITEKKNQIKMVQTLIKKNDESVEMQAP